MELKEYIKKYDLNIGQMAEELHIHRNHLSGIINKRTYASPRLAKEIHRYTRGEVAFEILVNTNEQKACPCCGKLMSANSKFKKDTNN